MADPDLWLTSSMFALMPCMDQVEIWHEHYKSLNDLKLRLMQILARDSLFNEVKWLVGNGAVERRHPFRRVLRKELYKIDCKAWYEYSYLTIDVSAGNVGNCPMHPDKAF